MALDSLKLAEERAEKVSEKITNRSRARIGRFLTH